MNYKTYLVGGAVRDALLGVPSKDLDFVIMAPSFAAMRDALLVDGCKIFVEKPEFLTIRANHPVLGCTDFACARRDGNYTDGRRPDSTSVTLDLTEDLARRDFTCNAIARDVETGVLFDPFHGIKAINERELVAVGNPSERLEEDKLRAFRALRFAATKGFRINTEVWSAINRLTPNRFVKVSTERIREELMKAFRADAKRAFTMLSVDFPVLWQIVSERGIWFKPTTEE